MNPDESNVVLVPRGGSWGASVAAGAADVGLTPWVLPLIETLPAASHELTEALEGLGSGAYDWLTVTSAAAVPALAQVQVPESTKVAAVGKVTAAALAEVGITADFVGDAGAQAMVDSWPEPGPGSVLAVQSDVARPLLVDGLCAQGWNARAVVAYRTAPVELSPSEEHALRSGKAAVALVTSGSVARRLAEAGVHTSTRLVAIGAQTAEDTRDAGLEVAAVASGPTIADLLHAAQQLVGERR